MMRRTSLLIVSAITLWGPAYSLCASAADGGVYVGANFGHTLSSYRRSDLDSTLSAAFGGAESGFALGATSVRKGERPWSVDVGYMVSPYFGVEASYLDLGTLKYLAAATESGSAGTSPVSINLHIQPRGPALALLGVLPMSNAWEVDARVGVYAEKTSTVYATAVDSSSRSGSDSKSAQSPLLGVGSSYTLSGHWAVRVDYIHLNQVAEKVLDRSFRADLATAGVIYAF